MNPSPSPVVHSSKNRRAVIWFAAVTVMLSLAILANSILIYCMSAEDPDTSGNRSDGITDVVVDVVYPDIEQRPSAEQDSIFTSMHHFVRKLAHFSEFALLGFLSMLLLCHLAQRLSALRLWMQWVIPTAFCLLYAISDEVHQIFSGRGPAVKDVLIDFAGAITGIVLARMLVWILRKIRRVLVGRGVLER